MMERITSKNENNEREFVKGTQELEPKPLRNHIEKRTSEKLNQDSQGNLVRYWSMNNPWQAIVHYSIA